MIGKNDHVLVSSEQIRIERVVEVQEIDSEYNRGWWHGVRAAACLFAVCLAALGVIGLFVCGAFLL